MRVTPFLFAGRIVFPPLSYVLKNITRTERTLAAKL